MKLTNLLVAASAAVLFTTGAQAATYDAFSSFNGTQGAGGFFYGDVVSPSSLALYTADTGCFIDGSTCLQRAANHDVPGYTKSTSPSFQYNTVNVPTDRLLAHPANDTSLASVLFIVSQAGRYTVTGKFNTQDVSPTGVDLFFLTATNNSYPITETQVGALAGAGSSFTYTTTLNARVGDVLGFGIGNGGLYYNDSTGVNFSLTSVPEPATWSLMIVGFGLVGFAMRRRSATTTVTYA